MSASPVVWVSAVRLSLVVVASAQPPGGHGVLYNNFVHPCTSTADRLK